MWALPPPQLVPARLRAVLTARASAMAPAASGASSMALGTGAQATEDNEVVIGTATNIYATPGVTSNASLAARAARSAS